MSTTITVYAPGGIAYDAPAFVTVAESTLRVVTGARFRRRVDITITPRDAA